MTEQRADTAANRNSDTVTEVNPFKDARVQQQLAGQTEITVRVVRLTHSIGLNSLQLIVGSGDNSWRRGEIIVMSDTPFYHRLLELDPRIGTLTSGNGSKDGRQLFPRFRVTVRNCGTHWEVVGHVPLSMDNKQDQASKAAQDIMDRLEDARREIGLGWQHGHRIIAPFQAEGGEGWVERAIAAMWHAYRMDRFRPEDNDCPFIHDLLDQPFDMQEYKSVASETFEQAKARIVPPPPETEELTQALGRGKGEPPVDDELTKPWIDITTERGKFWAKVNGDAENGFKSREESRTWTPEQIEEFVHKAVGGRLHETKYARQACEQRVLMALKKHFEQEKPVTVKEAEKAPETQAAAMPVPTKTSEAPTGKSEPQVALISSTIPETPFVVLFTLYTPGGLEMKYTVRAMSADALESQADDLIKRLIKKGYTTRRMAEVVGQAAAQNGGSTAPAPQNADKGTSPCVLIKCVKSYQAGKPQLEFEVDGFEKPFRFTQEKWEQLTKVLKAHTNGREFTAADMTEGKKYAGNWVLDWEKKTKDDKTFWNVLALRDAA